MTHRYESKDSVGVLTMHAIHNHGSALQAYATQRAIEGLGYRCELVDYRYPNSLHRKRASFSAQFLSQANTLAKRVVPGKPFEVADARFRDFLKEHLRCSRPYPTRASLLCDPPSYRTYLAGSDQLWNPKFIGEDDTFFLSFAPPGSRRVSYATSFGALTVPERMHEAYHRHLSAFDFISVRERTAVDLVKRFTGKHAEHVLDPTLLLSGSDWEAILDPFSYSRPYILCYGLNTEGPVMEALALTIQKKTGYDIVRVQGKAYHWLSRSLRYVFDAGPLQWLGLFRSAALVLSQSFHGTAFSILFRRPFLSLLRRDPDHNTRQTSLLRLLDLDDRAVYPPDTDPRAALADIDFDRVHSSLNHHRAASFEFLRHALR